MKNISENLKYIWKYYSNYKIPIIFLLFLGLLLSAFVSFANPLAIKLLFDEAIIKQNFRLFLLLSVLFVFVFSVWRISNWWYDLSFQKLKLKIFNDSVIKIATIYFEKDFIELKKNQGKDSYYVSRIYDDVYAAIFSTLEIISELLNTLVTMAVGLVVLLYLSGGATFILALVVPILFYLANKFGNKIKSLTLLESEEEALLKGVIGKVSKAYVLVKFFGLLSHAIDKINYQLNKIFNISYKKYKQSANYSTLSRLFMSFTEFSVTIICGYQILRGKMSFGAFMAYINAFWGVVGTAQSLLSIMPQIASTFGLFERIKDFEKASGQKIEPKFSNEYILFENVSFGYEENENIFENIELKIKKGDKILILGENGSGKSTFAYLLAGLLKPNDGSIITFSPEKISPIIMPFYFLPGPARINFNGNGSSKNYSLNLQNALKKLNLESKLDVDPENFSSGQYKKFEIIVGLSKNAELYIFDEPLANVDSESKEIIMELIFEATKNKTLIVIMHDAEKYRHRFDKIIYVGNKTVTIEND